MRAPIWVGTAAWNIPKASAAAFPAEGTHLSRYSARLPAVEINSSFYRDHRHATYERWAQSVPPDFRFSVKLSRVFTHELRLTSTGPRLRETLHGIAGLGEKWGCLLVQLPPSLAFESRVVEHFLGFLREHCPAPIAWEPRHRSWGGPEAQRLLALHGIVRVLADPEPCPAFAAEGTPALRYYRLHGSPEIYRSRYPRPFLERVAAEIREHPELPTWCIFDNTTFGFATENALELSGLLARGETGLRSAS